MPLGSSKNGTQERHVLLHYPLALYPSEPTNEASAEPSSLELCLARRRKTKVNPVKAGIVEHVKEYEYSSWCEYDGSVEPVFQICNTQTVLNRIPFIELEAQVNEPLPEDVYCLDIEGNSRRRPSDNQIWALIKEKTGVTNNSAFQQLDNDTKQQVFLELKDSGASLRQLERLTGIGQLSEQRAQCHACMSIVES